MLASYLDHSVTIDTHNWAVTMVRAQYSFHATIVIEKVKNDIQEQVTMHVAHLVGPMICRDINAFNHCFSFYNKIGQIETKRIDPKKLKYSSKSQTFRRSREKVQAMWEQIKHEEVNQKERPIPFSIFGRQSILTKKMEFFEVHHPELRELQKNKPREFMYLYDLNEEHKAIKYGIWGSSERIKNKPLLSNLAYNPFRSVEFAIANAKKSIGETVVNRMFFKDKFKLGIIIFLTFLAKDPYYIRTLFDEILKRVYIFSLNLFVKKGEGPAKQYIEKKALDNREKLSLIQNHVKKVFFDPDSCFTWAREKLKLLDVEIGKCSCDNLIAVTGLYI